MFKSTF